MKKWLSILISVLVALALAGCSSPDHDPTESTEPYKYSDFTAGEKAILTQHLQEVIPFASNDLYVLEGPHTPHYDKEGFHFYTIGSTAEDFLAYQANFTAYTLQKTYADDNGVTWYRYVKNTLIVDIAYYTNTDGGRIDVYAHSEPDEEPTEPPTEPSTEPDKVEHLYQAWSNNDVAIFTQYIGAVIPFLPNSEYYLEGYYDVADFEYGLCFYTFGNTREEFEAYLATYTDYVLDSALPDEYGIVWHDYIKDDVVVSMAYNEVNGDSSVYVYIYSDLSQTPPENDNKNVITNNNKGLPEDSDGDGVYDVNFKDATHVKDVHDQGYYLDGCPTVGAPGVLVIPIGFSDGHQLTPENIDKLEIAFGENGDYYYSVDNFYKISSYNQLDLHINVLDTWYVPAYNSAHYAALTDGEGNPNGDQVLMDEVLRYLEKIMDLSAYDSDNNGFIDAVVLINNLDVGDDDFHWAYRYWNTYGDDHDDYYTYDNVSANDYMWASYFFLHETYAGNDIVYGDTTVMNTYTYIHEFGHILGADDYYDTSSKNNHPMDGCDIMDYMLGDHNAYTKFNLGWLTTSRLVVTDSAVTLTLEDFSKNGDAILLANNWDPKLGAYQEYYIVVYYTRNGLNAGDYGYFARDGIVVYHVNSSLFSDPYGGETYYDVYNNNTDPTDPESNGTINNLIEFVKSGNNTFTYITGDSLPATRDDSGNVLGYTFTIDALTAESATITFTKR